MTFETETPVLLRSHRTRSMVRSRLRPTVFGQERGRHPSGRQDRSVSDTEHVRYRRRQQSLTTRTELALRRSPSAIGANLGRSFTHQAVHCKGPGTLSPAGKAMRRID